MPTPVSITGTVASSATGRIRPSPPRGIDQVDSPRARIRASTASWRSLGTSWTRPPAARASSAAEHVDEAALLPRASSSAQEDRVAALEAEAGGVDGDVGPALVDHADDTHRHADLAHLQAVGQRVARDDLADRVGQRGDVAQASAIAASRLGVKVSRSSAADGGPRPGDDVRG